MNPSKTLGCVEMSEYNKIYSVIDSVKLYKTDDNIYYIEEGSFLPDLIKLALIFLWFYYLEMIKSTISHAKRSKIEFHRKQVIKEDFRNKHIKENTENQLMQEKKTKDRKLKKEADRLKFLKEKSDKKELKINRNQKKKKINISQSL
jgi:hypothetical protein